MSIPIAQFLPLPSSLFLKQNLIYLNWRLITLQYYSGFCHTLIWIRHGHACVPHPEPPSHLHPHPIPQGHPRCTSPEHPVSCIKPGLVVCFTYDNIHVSMLFSHSTPPSPFPTESKRLFYTFVSLFLSRIQGYRYHLSKFHIYGLVYCMTGEGNGNPLQYSCLENPMDGGVW